MTMPISPVGTSEAATTAEAAPALLNRELSWLEFNRRVLAEALDGRNPTLERVRFLAITASNLDEFFTTRVGWLKRIALRSPDMRTADGMTVAEQLPLIRDGARALRAEIEHTWREVLVPALREHGVQVVPYAALAPEA